MDEGATAVALGELVEAEDWYRKATEADSGSYDAWHALSMVLLKLERYPESIKAGMKAVEIDPDGQMAYTSLSIAYARNNQIKEAEDMGAKARIISWGGKVSKMGAQPEP